MTTDALWPVIKSENDKSCSLHVTCRVTMIHGTDLEVTLEELDQLLGNSATE